jgi:hypothetical protein
MNHTRYRRLTLVAGNEESLGLSAVFYLDAANTNADKGPARNLGGPDPVVLLKTPGY